MKNKPNPTPGKPRADAAEDTDGRARQTAITGDEVMKKSEKKELVTVRMPAWLKSTLGEKACKEGQSLNAMILLLIQKALKG